MTLRRHSLEARLRKLERVVSRLRRHRSCGAQRFRDDEDVQWSVERGLQIGCEAVLGSGNHLLAAVFRRPAETYEDIVSGLVAEGVLARELGAELGGLGGFRNVLVHGYLDVDPDRVWAALEQAPERFDRFALAVAKPWDGHTRVRVRDPRPGTGTCACMHAFQDLEWAHADARNTPGCGTGSISSGRRGANSRRFAPAR